MLDLGGDCVLAPNLLKEQYTNLMDSGKRSIVRMLMRLALVIAFVVAGNIPGGFLPTAEASEAVVRVIGEVTAVNTTDVPQIVVIRVMTKSGEEMIIGALIEEKTRIKKQGKSVKLDQVAEGDKILLAYKRTPKGVLARSITIP